MMNYNYHTNKKLQQQQQQQQTTTITMTTTTTTTTNLPLIITRKASISVLPEGSVEVYTIDVDPIGNIDPDL